MKYLASQYDIGYPLYGAKFLSSSVLLVTGGGGQANTDIPNKLTALKVDFDKKKVIKRFREITLDSKDDCPTTLDAALVHNREPLSNVILMGCNEHETQGAPNHHLRKFTFENDHLKFKASADFNRSNDPNEFTKLTALSSDGSVGAIASSKLPTVIRIIDPLNMEEKYEIETGNMVKDLHFSPDGKVICYITETTLEVISIVTGRFIIRKTDFNKQVSLSKVRFLTNDIVVVAGILNGKTKSITISKINIKTTNTTVLLSKSITSSYNDVTAMDTSNDGELISLATNESALLIIKSKDLSITRSFKRIHQGDITRVTFSPDSQLVASVSSANSIYLIKLPPGLGQSTSFFQKLLKLFINILLTIGIVVVAYLAYYFDLHTKSYQYINDKYLTKRDTSQYFQMNDGSFTTSTEIIDDDIISIHTLTGHIHTASDFTTDDMFGSVETKLASITSNIWSEAGSYDKEYYEQTTVMPISESAHRKSSPAQNPTTSTSTQPESIGSTISKGKLSSAASTSSVISLRSFGDSSLELPESSTSAEAKHLENMAPSILTSGTHTSTKTTSEVAIPTFSFSKKPLSEVVTSVAMDSKNEQGSLLATTEVSEVYSSEYTEPTTFTESVEPTPILKKDSGITKSIYAGKHTITVDGIVYEVVSVSRAPTTTTASDLTIGNIANPERTVIFHTSPSYTSQTSYTASVMSDMSNNTTDIGEVSTDKSGSNDLIMSASSQQNSQIISSIISSTSNQQNIHIPPEESETNTVSSATTATISKTERLGRSSGSSSSSMLSSDSTLLETPEHNNLESVSNSSTFKHTLVPTSSIRNDILLSTPVSNEPNVTREQELVDNSISLEDTFVTTPVETSTDITLVSGMILQGVPTETSLPGINVENIMENTTETCTETAIETTTGRTGDLTGELVAPASTETNFAITHEVNNSANEAKQATITQGLLHSSPMYQSEDEMSPTTSFNIGTETNVLQTDSKLSTISEEASSSVHSSGISTSSSIIYDITAILEHTNTPTPDILLEGSDSMGLNNTKVDTDVASPLETNVIQTLISNSINLDISEAARSEVGHSPFFTPTQESLLLQTSPNITESVHQEESIVTTLLSEVSQFDTLPITTTVIEITHDEL